MNSLLPLMVLVYWILLNFETIKYRNYLILNEKERENEVSEKPLNEDQEKNSAFRSVHSQNASKFYHGFPLGLRLSQI